MKTIETKLYSYSELSESAQSRVIRSMAENVYSDSDNDTLCCYVDSLKAIVGGMDLSLSNWSIGPDNRNNYASVNVPWHREVQLEGGNRTVAAFLRMLIEYGYSRPRCFREMEFPGICGFTGMVYDEEVLESIWEALLRGESFNSAVDGASDTIARHCEEDLDWRASKDGILYYLDQSEEIYTEDGETF
jgi:hypothetical protein